MPAEGNRLAGLIVRRARWKGSVTSGLVTLFACGDVMPGRGIDEVLPHPGDPGLCEDHARDANAYVRLAVCPSGAIPG
jgi:poly-gamma-glutamate capsule biosynthesis protein CapA/YwtB (metallophosphatase superfamily)